MLWLVSFPAVRVYLCYYSTLLCWASLDHPNPLQRILASSMKMAFGTTRNNGELLERNWGGGCCSHSLKINRPQQERMANAVFSVKRKIFSYQSLLEYGGGGQMEMGRFCFAFYSSVTSQSSLLSCHLTAILGLSREKYGWQSSTLGIYETEPLYSIC